MAENNQPNASEARVIPFVDAASAREAIRCFSRPVTEREQIVSIQRKLEVSNPEILQNITRNLLENFENLVIDGQHATFALVEFVIRQNLDVSRLIQPLAAQVANRDEVTQNRAIDLICSVGPLAKPAEDVAMGCLRNSDAAIRMAGARILFAIGPACSRSIIRQLRAVAQRFTAEKEFCALLLATVRKIGGTTPPVSGSSQNARDVTGSYEPINPDLQESARSNITEVLYRLLENKALLLVDDNEELRRMVGEMFRDKLRMAVIEAATGQQALAAVQECGRKKITIDYIVLDLKMPDMNGVQVLKKLREAENTAETPVVIISAVADERILAALGALGAHEYVHKPFRMNQLIRALVAAYRARISA